MQNTVDDPNLPQPTVPIIYESGPAKARTCAKVNRRRRSLSCEMAVVENLDLYDVV